MSFSFDPKEELRLRMADLEDKLAESVNERHSLEKTANVLMRAFREEEKIQYKMLNKNYEKFLQDCSARKKRNDIILRSLCRIEDRSRALFAKTERLKLLKDRYISYLKIIGIKERISPRALRTLPASSSTQKSIEDVSLRPDQWRNSLPTNCKVVDLRGNEGSSNLNYEISGSSPTLISYIPHTRYEKYNHEQRAYGIGKSSKIKGFERLSINEAPNVNIEVQNKLNLVHTRLGFPLEESLDSPIGIEEMTRTIHQETPTNNHVFNNSVSNELKVKDLIETSESKNETDILSHQEPIEKLKNTLSFEEELFDNEIIDERNDPYQTKIAEKDDRKKNEKKLANKQNNYHDLSLPRTNHYMKTSSSSILEKEYQDNLALDEGKEKKTSKPAGNLPMGLDGVDYQNETYPESYYEQPVHYHNHTSIVADVILEEDETEQDVDEEEKNTLEENELLPKGDSLEANMRKESPEHGTYKSADKLKLYSKNEANSFTEFKDKDHELKGKAKYEVKDQEFNSEKLFTGKSVDSDGSEPKSEKSVNNLEGKKNVRSNLIHLLESDSESFQIEHGDAVSANEDSDFDFSFQ